MVWLDTGYRFVKRQSQSTQSFGGLMPIDTEAVMDAGTVVALATLVTAMAGLLAELRRWRKRGR